MDLTAAMFLMPRRRSLFKTDGMGVVKFNGDLEARILRRIRDNPDETRVDAESLDFAVKDQRSLEKKATNGV
jgi:hypothetical protein